MPNILLVEDDASQRALTRSVLAHDGHNMFEASNAIDALLAIEKSKVDLAIIDVMLPGMDGMELTSMLRSASMDMPILMVTAKDSSRDKHRGFHSGIDDYLVKPVDFEELRLRVRALLRRASINQARRIEAGSTVIDLDSYTIIGGGRSETLPQKEFLLLYKLMSYPDKIFTRLQLMDEIWGMDSQSDERTVDVHISRLRSKLEAYPEISIEAVRGLGYKGIINEA